MPATTFRIFRYQPDSADAEKVVKELRVSLAEVDPTVLVGGETAIALDTNETAQADLTKIIPIVLAVIFIILMLLLGTLLFIQDNDRLVLRPLERMVRKARACVCVVVCVGGQGHAAANAHPVALAGAGEASG